MVATIPIKITTIVKKQNKQNPSVEATLVASRHPSGHILTIHYADGSKQIVRPSLAFQERYTSEVVDTIARGSKVSSYRYGNNAEVTMRP